MIESWLFDKLSPLVAGKVYGSQAPPNTAAPYIVFRQVSGLDVAIDSDTDQKADRWQIDSYAGGYTPGRELARSIKSAIKITGFDGGLCIYKSQFDTEDLYDTQIEQHYQSSDLIIEYSE